MHLSNYLDRARHRLVHQAGFVPMEHHLPELLRQAVPVLLFRPADHGPVAAADLFVALVPADALDRGGRAAVVTALGELAAAQARRTGGRSVALAAFVFAGSLIAPDVEAVAALRQDWPAGAVTLVPWIVDLETEQLLCHQGAPHLPREVAAALADFAQPAFPPAPAPDGSAGDAAANGWFAPSPAPAAPLPRPPAALLTYLLLGVVVAVYLWIETHGGSTATNLIRWGANFPPRVVLAGEYWRLLTSVFLHGGATHLFMNGLVLFHMGQLLETLFGHWRFGFIFLVAGLAGSTASLTFGTFHIPSVGASGALFGLFGAMVYFRLVSPRGFHIPWSRLLIPIAINLSVGLIIPNVDNWAHVGGLVGGLVAAAVVGLPGRRWMPWRWAAAAAALAGSVALVGGAVPLDRPEASLYRGAEALEQGDYARAEAELRRAADVDAGDWRPHLGLAEVYARTGRYEEARAEAQAVLSLDPGNRQAQGILRALPQQR